MSRLKTAFRAALRKIADPVLAEAGFALDSEHVDSGYIPYVRTYRGHSNILYFTTSNWEKAFWFGMITDKSRTTSENLPGEGGRWQYSGQEDLERGMQEAMRLFLTEGVKWFETYTPGNVPDWKEPVAQILGQYIGSLGMVCTGDVTPSGRQVADIAWFQLPGESWSGIALSLQVPGSIRVGFQRQISKYDRLEGKDGPVFHYSTAEDMKDALKRVLEYLKEEAPEWFARTNPPAAGNRP